MAEKRLLVVPAGGNRSALLPNLDKAMPTYPELFLHDEWKRQTDDQVLMWRGLSNNLIDAAERVCHFQLALTREMLEHLQAQSAQLLGMRAPEPARRDIERRDDRPNVHYAGGQVKHDHGTDEPSPLVEKMIASVLDTSKHERDF